MNKMILLSLAAAAIAAPVGLPAQTTAIVQPTTGTRLDINATGTVTRVPDLAIISAGVVTKSVTATGAIADNAARMERVRAALSRHVAVLLEVDPVVAWKRVTRAGAPDRPLARDGEAFTALHAGRATLYDSLADAVLPPGDKRLAARAAPSLRRLARAPARTRLLWAASDYPVFVGRGLLGSDVMAPSARGERSFCVTDDTVGELYAGRVGDLASTVTFSAGELSKTVATAERVWRELARMGMNRSDRIVALGGGVVGDLAGFCAATYQRGVAVLQVPTTLVAQVDSAYGGKTGVDLPEAKNYVGAYHQPAGVVADVTTLDTLPPRERAAGYAEVVKTALIAGGDLWRRVAAGEAVDDAMIFECARTKLAVVSRDERDAGPRQVLNLGHTVGHAIETASGYGRYRHGEAVGLGLLAALRLSGRADLRAEVLSLFREAGLPTELDGADPHAVVLAVARDKKRRDGVVPFVLVDSPGDVRTGCRVADGDLLAAVAELTVR